jgi:hypothetical protein
MKEQPNSQTAYQHNAHSISSDSEGNDHGWADAINRMIDQRYAFLAMEYENNGYLFRGMSSGLLNALLKNKFWHYSGEERGAHLERELDVLFLSQDFSDALTVSKLWEQKSDACIIVFKSEIFNLALNEKKAAMMATAEPGVVFKYPFLSQPLTLDDIEYLIVSTELLHTLQDSDKSGALNGFKEPDSNQLALLISDSYETGKLFALEQSEENYHRSSLEKALMKCLLNRDVSGAKAISSNFKPTLKQ